jgi:DNA-binding winged helix-turn-helix (wHTH) protein/TolB-like protein/tetratricopeptide (TPR) repeat protein
MTAHPPRLRFGAFEIDVKAGELWKHGRRIRLQEQPYRVLLALLEVPGETVTRQELRERLWPAETFVDFDNGLNNVINRLRTALGDSATSPRLIETVGRRGYRFIGEVASPAALPEASIAMPAQGVPQATEPIAATPPLDAATAGASGVSRAVPDAAGPVIAEPATAPSVTVEDTAAAHAEPTFLPGAIAAGHSPSSSTRWGLIGAAVAAGLLVIASAIGMGGPARLDGWFGGTELSASPGIRSLGILPLADPADPPDGLFAYGMVNAVIAELSRFQALKVVSPTSDTAFRDQTARSPRQLAQELGVDTLLRGTVTRDEREIGVNLELIDGATGQPLWNQSFTRPAADVLALRSDVVRDVVRQVQSRLTPTLQPPAPERVTANTRAYEAYLRGQFETLHRNPTAFARAVNYFQYALTLDPDYAPALAGVAWARLQQSSWAGDDHPRRHIEEVRAAITRALALDPNLAEAHVALAMASRIYNWDWVGAEAAVRRAIQLKPSSAMAQNEYTRLLLCLGRFPEALTQAQKTLALDPNAPIYWLTEGVVLYNLRRLEDAEARYRRALELEPDFSSARRRLVRLYLVQGRLDEAGAMFQQLDQQPSRSSIRILRAQFEAMRGNAAEARRILSGTEDAVLVRDLPTVAAAHLALGNRAAALAALKRGVEERTVQPLSLAAPELDPLRDDPAFAQLLEEMRLPSSSVVGLVGVNRQNIGITLSPAPPATIAAR